MLARQLKQFVNFLAADSLQGRFAGTRESRIAANFIATEMQRIGLHPVAGFDGYYTAFVHLNDTLKNVLGAIAGTSQKDEVVIFCAHYDHIGTLSKNPDRYFHPPYGRDTIYNGANDNASGVAALLTLAYLIRHDTIPPLRTSFFVAFDGEEIDELGSDYLAGLSSPDQIIAVINLEMLGIPNKRSPFITATPFSNIKEVLNSNLERANANLYGREFFKEDKYTDQGLWKRSDNYPFLQRKIAAHTIMVTNPSNPLYHSANDEVGTLNYMYMAELVGAIKIATAPLLNQDIKLKVDFSKEALMRTLKAK